MIGYKLMRVRRDGSLGSLFIGRRRRYVLGTEYRAVARRTPGYAFRPGFHVCPQPYAPHLSERGRQWFKVRIREFSEHHRPARQGGRWYTAKYMTILEPA